MEDQQEPRLDIVEARLAFCEERLRAIERFIGDAVRTTRPRKRPLTDEEKKAVRERLMRGQEAARARREAEAKKAAKDEKKEARNEQVRR